VKSRVDTLETGIFIYSAFICLRSMDGTKKSVTSLPCVRLQNYSTSMKLMKSKNLDPGDCVLRC
jgi:hypothetical protein